MDNHLYAKYQIVFFNDYVSFIIRVSKHAIKTRTFDYTRLRILAINCSNIKFSSASYKEYFIQPIKKQSAKMSIMIKQGHHRDSNISANSRKNNLISTYRSQHTSNGGVAFARYPSELAFKAHLQLQQKLSLKDSGSVYVGKAFNQGMAVRIRGLPQHQPQRNTLRPVSHRQKIRNNEVNNNLVRVWNEVEKAMIRQKTGKTFPFKIVKSLSACTLKKKEQVQKIRKQIQKRHQYNPFGSPAIDSEYLN